MRRRNDFKKIFYFILPVKQNGYPDLTAWTDNEFLVSEYVRQYEKLEPVVLCCEGTSIVDPDVKKFIKDNLDVKL